MKVFYFLKEEAQWVEEFSDAESQGKSEGGPLDKCCIDCRDFVVVECILFTTQISDPLISAWP